MIKFREVEQTANDIDLLFSLLKNRKLNISHKIMPTYEEHSSFVKKNSYRFWYLIFSDDEFIGSFYILNNNHVGINFIDDNQYQVIDETLDFISSKFKPLKAIPSKRVENFFINVPPDKEDLINYLLGNGAQIIEHTVSFPNK